MLLQDLIEIFVFAAEFFADEMEIIYVKCFVLRRLISF